MAHLEAGTDIWRGEKDESEELLKMKVRNSSQKLEILKRMTLFGLYSIIILDECGGKMKIYMENLSKLFDFIP